MKHLKLLLEEYYKAPEIFQAGKYWKRYEDKIINEIMNADLNQLRNGAHPVFGTFGFSESVYHYREGTPLYTRFFKQLIRALFITNRATMPYSLRLDDIREMAYINCKNQGQLANIKPITEIEASTFGNPSDLFEINGNKYTMQFLNYYIRLCFAQKYLNLRGKETIVELGSGSGFQIEVLKKVFPNLTIFCFDLPYSLCLCEHYLSKVFKQECIVGSLMTAEWSDLRDAREGHIHLFGNWKFPILNRFPFDVFWNAASFGEMEPNIVMNYLSYIIGSCNFIYLLQAKLGKGGSGVRTPILSDDYDSMLMGYHVLKKENAYQAHRKMSQSGGYFHGVWKKSIKPPFH